MILSVGMTILLRGDGNESHGNNRQWHNRIVILTEAKRRDLRFSRPASDADGSSTTLPSTHALVRGRQIHREPVIGVAPLPPQLEPSSREQTDHALVSELIAVLRVDGLASPKMK